MRLWRLLLDERAHKGHASVLTEWDMEQLDHRKLEAVGSYLLDHPGHIVADNIEDSVDARTDTVIDVERSVVGPVPVH